MRAPGAAMAAIPAIGTAKRGRECMTRRMGYALHGMTLQPCEVFVFGIQVRCSMRNVQCVVQ